MQKNEVEPQLCWPMHIFNADGGGVSLLESAGCPSLDELKESGRHYGRALSPEKDWRRWKGGTGQSRFWRSFFEADEVFIIERYFVKHFRHKLIANQISGALIRREPYPRNIFVFAERRGVKASPTSDFQAELANHGICNCHAEIRDISELPIHDRYVLCDDAFWQCGESIGGMCAQLHSISGPWPDKNGGLRKFCDELMHLDVI